MFRFLKQKIAGWIKKPVEEKKETEIEVIEKTKEEKRKEIEKKHFEKPVKGQKESKEISKKEKDSPELIEVVEATPDKKEKKSFFSSIKEKFTSKKIDEDYFESIFEQLEMILLENNVAMSVVDSIKQNLQQELIGKEAKRNELERTIKEALKKAISDILIEPFDIIGEIKSSPSICVIVFFGINGSGKTTSLAKFAHLLRKNGISSVFAAADTFRAASMEQLIQHGNMLGVSVVKQTYGSDPAAVAYDAIKYAQAHKIKCVLVDTAGRMHTKQNLMQEMAKIVRVTNPQFKIFVGESITGNDATEQAKTFSEAIGIDGIILTKSDVDEKGGTALSVSKVTGKPILFLGTGQEYDKLQPFSKQKILDALGL